MKRNHGDGGIDTRGPDTHRLRWRADGRRHIKTVHGSITEARKELRRLLKTADDGKHVAPDRITFAGWITQWLTLKERTLEPQTWERYDRLMRNHVVPALGARPLQRITAIEIDGLYAGLKLAPRTMTFLHVVVKSCFATAIKKKLIASNPVADAEKPAGEDKEAGTVLEEAELLALVQGFKGSSIYPVVAVAAFTGMRRNEILALRWADIDFGAKAISITRSVERTKKHGRRIKGPKTKRGYRTIEIDDGLAALLREEREQHLRLVAGVAGSAEVDLSLVPLPQDALCFLAIGASLTTLRSPNAVTDTFDKRAARLGYPDLRFHDLRGSHATLLLDKGVPVHVVAKRIGDDPAILLRWYAKRTKKADTSAANIIGTLTKGVL